MIRLLIRHERGRCGAADGTVEWMRTACQIGEKPVFRHATASAVVLRAGQVLLLESAKGIGSIYPGGHVDNEDPAENGGKAAARKK